GAVPDPLVYYKGNSLSRDTVLGLAPNPCMSSNRELVLAAVQKGTTLSDTGGGAVAAAAVADPRTIQDIAAPIESCPFSIFGTALAAPDGTPDPLGRQWGFSNARCNPGEKDSAPHKDDTFGNGIAPPPGYEAVADCPADGDSVDASAVTTSGASGDITVQKATSETRIEHKPEGGL